MNNFDKPPEGYQVRFEGYTFGARKNWTLHRNGKQIASQFETRKDALAFCFKHKAWMEKLAKVRLAV